MTVGTVVAMVAAVGQVGGAPSSAAAAAGPGPDAATGGEVGRVVTLVTGDRVRVSSVDAMTASVIRGKGREKVSFTMFGAGGHLYVIPSDAQRLIRSGKVDRRLFDVTNLLRSGYDDAARSTIPLLLQYRSGGPQAAADAVGRFGAKVTRPLPTINGAAVSAEKAGTAALWTTLTVNRDTERADTTQNIRRIWLDGRLKPLLDRSVPQIGAPTAWKAGFTGKGVAVAVLDTGIDNTHPDLAGKVVQKDFSGTGNDDTEGHGTHVGSTIAGTGAASGGRYRGVAPDATLLAGKVCGSEACEESAILAGMQWATVEQHARVVNMSLGETDTPEVGPLEEAVTTLTAQTGALFVIAAGNEGPDASTVGSPGNVDAALTVGAVDKSDELAKFSSRGPRVGDAAIKPDITAPGVDITAARSAAAFPEIPADQKYVALDGTSMATPHVAGAAALLAQQHPDWKAAQLKAALMGSAKPHPKLSAFEQGAGRVDLSRAITETVTADPPSLSYGRAVWPHTDDKPVTKTVTYRNTGKAPVTLDLTVQAAGGAPASAGLFTVSPTKLTVAAGATATAQVTADTTVGAPDGIHTGRLVATAGDLTVLTPVAVDKEKESYNLTLKHLDTAGRATGRYLTGLVNLDTDEVVLPYEESGTVTTRLPKGRYGLCSFIGDPGGEPVLRQAMLVQPRLQFAADQTIAVDARTAKPVTMTVPQAGATASELSVAALYPPRKEPITCQAVQAGFDGLSIGQIGSAVPVNQFATVLRAQFTKPGPDGEPADDSPYAYQVAEIVPGRVPAGLDRRYRAADFAAVDLTTRAPVAGMMADRTVWPVIAGHELDQLLATSSMAAPGTRRDYFTVAGGLRWTSLTSIGVPEVVGPFTLVPGPFYRQPATAYPAGRRTAERYGVGPFGPGFAATPDEPEVNARTGDTILAVLPSFTDVDGHAGRPYISDPITKRTALYRNGELVAETPYDAVRADVPAERATYRLDTSATGGVGDLSTEVTSSFTFTSEHNDGEQPARLPLSAVRFTPKLDDTSAAPAGATVTIPVTVQRLPGSTATAVRSLTVEASFDDGRTWRPVTLERDHGMRWTATLTHPNTAGYVSLRAETADTAGNSVRQTIIHAYRLTAR